ncbi:MAG: beta-galactosidase, partial [candidate division KSB1 bacterium]|nr:beta-galactosidase [candidate division KSB1 bacterium]
MTPAKMGLGIVLWAAHLCAYSMEMPHLARRGDVAQLMVDGRPFIILGGELGNSTASNLLLLQSVWPTCKSLGLNTLLAPVYWEMLEPEETVYDFSLVDTLLIQARRYGFRLVLLWFGSWKNSMSCYAPLWVKNDPDRFPRARDEAGRPMEILSAFYQNNREADARAFRTLMRHLREIDGDRHTVIMVQVENEVGMIPTARDHVQRANELFASEVPHELMDYLVSHREALRPELANLWRKGGFRRSGTWGEVFGKGEGTEELFMAWHLARYVNFVAAAGKEEYPLPMFVNAALNRPTARPGEYPSGGPLPHLLDVWRAAAPAIDIFAPDIYFADFESWCAKYTRAGNPLFIPEAARGDDAGVHALYAFGQHHAFGFSPFSIESIPDPTVHPLGQAYRLV